MRVLLRQWRDEDRQLYAAINRDPEVMRYLGMNADSAGDLEVEQQVARRRGDVAREFQAPWRPLFEELAAADLQDRGNDEP